MNTAALNGILLASEGRRSVASGRMRALRVRAKLTQNELARALGVTHCAISEWERGRRLPRSRHAAAIGALLREIEGSL